MEEKRIALLIDGENISSKYVESILDEVSKHGVITYKRIYGNWASIVEKKWEEKIRENSITPMMQINNTAGKNASDSALIIDAMDILYTNAVEGFCIASSDGDFTRLASRLREAGMMVIGMGEEKTPKSFRAACSIFTNINVLMDQERAEHETNRQVIENYIVDVITQNENKGKTTELGEVGSKLVNKFPDFDVRNYGYSLLSKFLEEISTLSLDKHASGYAVSLKDDQRFKEAIDQHVRDLVKAAGDSGENLSELSKKLRKKYKDFNVRDYGYSTFSKFLQSIEGIEQRGVRNKKAYSSTRKKK
ncbi:MAG: NYN domain-containing protein [Anaerovoracaceae bacterium]